MLSRKRGDVSAPAGDVATDPLEQQMNTILFVVNEKPLTFAIELLGLYSEQCGP